MKGGQLLHSIYTVTLHLWRQYENPTISFPVSYHGSPFSNVDITISPIPSRPHQTLMLVNVKFGLVIITSDSQGNDYWPSGVTAQIKDRSTFQYVGIIRITDNLISGPLYLLNTSNPSLKAVQENNITSTLTVTTGLGSPTYTSHSLCQPQPQPLTLGHPIPENIWLEVFHSLIFRCFIDNQIDQIHDLLQAPGSWPSIDKSRAVKMTLQFYDLGLEMYLHEIVLGVIKRYWSSEW